MFEALLHGLLMMLTPEALLYQIFGISLGLVFGVIPGLSGIQALAILIPFIYGLEPGAAFSFLLGANVAATFGGSITAILLNIPGTALNIATCWDGHPLARQGRAGEALGIAASSSALGGVFGVFVLALSIPILQVIVSLFQTSELFMISLLGLTLIVTLSSKSMLKGIVSGLLGLSLAFVGEDPMTGWARYTFGSVYLLDGINLIAVVTGLYAIGEMAKLFVEGGAVSKEKLATGVRGVWKGIQSPFKHWFLVLRCSAIGALIGACPGVGGTVANVVAYGHAAQTEKDPDSFGTGRVEGVIAPESSNNSKDGAQMIPTLALGIPGGEGTAILLGAFLILGLQPGPSMITEHLNITFSIMWIIAISSIVASIIGLLFAVPLSKITAVPGRLLAPLIISFGAIGAFASTGAIENIFVAFGFGILGFYMRRFGYSEACLIIGLVLGTIVERNYHIAINLYGNNFFYTRPISLFFLIAIIAILVISAWRRTTERQTHGGVQA